ncbi:GRIP domain protein [Necator americanus]|uniref:GRIP domain protein n=1 Tax=Necator americanus TaxID=51031 RepID=W2TJP2_NECAM|nr:GRIP domain protein [Necator americanus]ETN81391.1 GRIP domain protein [Necator americanus]
MFKGLKSKLEDEAKKLQASVQQYSEQLTQQVEHMRHAASDAGSEGGSSITRRFLNTVGGSSSPDPHSVQDSLNLSVGDTLMEEVTEGDLLGLELSSRQRRLSGGSTHSTESSLSTLFQSVPGLAGTTLDTADSDNETLDEYGSGVIKTASKDQISNVLSRLQGRATSYKDKYRDLVKKYNEVVTENNKCRTVLAQTQDKALARIDKLRNEKKVLAERLREIEESRSSSSPADQKLRRYEEMLEKCKAEITKNRTKIKELTQENEKLLQNIRAAEGESDISSLVVDRVTNEWKQRIDKVEEEWTARMNKNDEDHAIQLATAKAEMHAALEAKDRELESWRSKCHTLEFQDGQANERWQKKVDELQQIIQALEVEKGDMIEKLSTAKQQGVKKSDLESARSSEISMREAHEGTLSVELENVRKQLTDMEERSRKEVSELKDSMAATVEKHRIEVSELVREHDEIVASVKQQQAIELQAATERFEQAQEQADGLRLKNERLEKQLEEADETCAKEKDQIENLKEQLTSLQEKLKNQDAVQHERTENEIVDLRNSYSRLCESNDDLKKQLDVLNKKTAEQLLEANQKESTVRAELEELRSMLESRNAQFRLMELRTEELEAELATARELSTMHEHLKAELEKVRKQRDDVELMVASLRERAERAEKTLEEDRARLLEERSALEKSMEEREKLEVLVPLSSDSKTGDMGNDNLTELIDLTSTTAVEMTTTDELQQLRAEIAQLNQLNRQLSNRIQQLEVEKNTFETTQGVTPGLLEDLRLGDASFFDKSAMLEKLDKLEAETKDVVLNMSEKAESVELENIRLTNELKKNVLEIEKARVHREALESQLQELKELFANRHPNTSEAEMMSHIEEEHLSGGRGDQKMHFNSPLGNESEELRLFEMKQQHEAEITLLNDNIRTLTSEKNALESRHVESEHQRVSLEEQLAILNEEIKQLRDSVTEEKKRADEAFEIVKQKTVEHEEKSAALLFDLKEKVDNVSRLEEKLEEARKKEEDAHSRLAVSESKCSELETRLDDLVLELDKTSATLAEERARAGSELTHLQELRSAAETQNSKLEQITAQLEATEEKLQAKEQELEAAKHAQMKKSSVVSDLEDQVAHLEHQLQENAKKAAEDLERSSATHKQLEQNLLAEEKRVLELLEQLKTEKAEAKRREHRAKDDAKQDQENVIKELRAEIEKIQSQYKESSDVDEKKLRAAEDRIAQLKAESEKATSSIVETQAKLLVAEEKLRNVEESRKQEKSEEERIREQYANALENLKSELAEAHSRMKATVSAEKECEKLRLELEQVRKQCEEEIAKQKEESETSVQEFKTRAEKKLAKIKAAAEKDVTSAKAELLLEMDELRRNLSDRDRRIDELVVEKARMEQQIIGQQEIEKELEQRRTKEKELTDFRKTVERRVVELETENRLLGERNAELSKCKEENDARLEESQRNIQQLQDKIKSLENANEEGFRKAAAKHDSDSKKAVRELQREVKQLYVELNEKTEALDTANARLAELESSSSKEDEETIERQTHQMEDASPNYGYEEELESMRKKLKDSHREVDSLREENSRLERLMDQQSKANANTPAIIHVNGGDCVGFADPAEAEYLKNVLYRYMYSRENLGKEAVTLARVIGTVAKFSKSEMENVITREESRVAGWVGGTVSHVLTGR